MNLVTPADFSLDVYSVQGRLCARYRTAAAGRFSIDLRTFGGGLGRGMYIAHVNLAGKKSVRQIAMW